MMFSGLLTKALAALAVVAGILVSIFAFGRQKKAEGRRDAEHEQLEELADAVREKSDLDSDLVDPDERERLREKHYRD